MKKFFLLILIFSMNWVTAQVTIWSIGESNNSAEEFALAPDGYTRFLEKDFGWEDQFFAIGFSKEEENFPYVLPGSIDYWGGTSSLAGIRPHEVNVLFSLNQVVPDEEYLLVIDILDCNPEKPPLLKLSMNEGFDWKHQLEPGLSEEALKGTGSLSKEQKISIPIDGKYLVRGGNRLRITTLEGSWMVFDHIELQGPAQSLLIPAEKAFVGSVKPAAYEIGLDESNFQPLLVDVQHLQGTAEITVILDEAEIFSKTLESGRSVFEVPMKAVAQPKQSSYRILINEKLVQEGVVNRSSQNLIKKAQYVDTKIGTGHSRWMIAPGPWMPFSMVKISPDNQNSGWQAGYQPSFESVGTFSHIHEWTMAGLGTFPTNGPLQFKMGRQDDPDGGYRSRVDKRSEEAPIGYYAVQLSDYDIHAELTATTRCSFQRYTYPDKSEGSRILIDLQIPAEYGYQIEAAYFEKVGDHKIIGYSKQISPSVWGEGYYRKQFVENGDQKKEWDDIKQEYTVNFVMEFDAPIQDFGIWSVGEESQNKKTDSIYKESKVLLLNPKDVVAYVNFNTGVKKTVQVRTGLSYVSIDNAQLNLDTEISQPFGWNFDGVRKNQLQTWDLLLNRIHIRSDDRMEKTRFYSNMYRALVSRNIFSDVDGSWMDAEERPQRFDDPNSVALGCDAFWNTFWNLNQFWNLATPDWSSKWVNSQLAMYDAHGWLAKGPAGMEYIPVMVAEHEIPLIVSAYQMGIRDFDAEKAFEAVYKMQTTAGAKVGNGYAGNRDLPAYMKYKYVPYNKGRFSNTLEYSFDDFAVSQLAMSLNKEAAYREFIDRGYWWQNAIHPDLGYAVMKHSDGTWFPDFDPIKTGGNFQYVEGNAWQLTFFVPQDVPALASMIGEDVMVKRLSDGFNTSSTWRYNAPNELYWDFPVTQGNQQSMHFSFLFNWLRKPWLTQKWSRDILDRYYGYGISNAYLGDEDQGQMSAWFLMAAMGLFQIDGGVRSEPIYEIGSPLFEMIEIDLGSRYGRGKSFTIHAKNASFKNKYVQSATLNGKVLKNFWFPASALLGGGELILEMGDEPNREWGSDKLP